MSPAYCNAEYIRKYLKKLESEFAFPFRWVDYCTLDGLDVYEQWLDEKKQSVEKMRHIRKTFLEKYDISDGDSINF